MATTSELGDFLRSRREHLTPHDVGLRDSGRRRTPGLRREEVATLAGISIDYLVRLEQGRDKNPSREVVSALADALQLSTSERHHLSLIAAIGDNHDMCPGAGESAADTLRPTIVDILERLDPTPAFVLGPYGDVLGWNDAWGELAGGIGMIDGNPPNLPRFVFSDERALVAYTDWSHAADEQVAMLRAAALRWRDDDRLAALLDELRAHPEFDVRWARHDVADKTASTKALRHPDHGPLLVRYEVMSIADDAGQQLVTWLPGDDATARVIDRDRRRDLVSPAQLRVVGQP
jgi:transcriptional regulator with XRE-family HTH domain